MLSKLTTLALVLMAFPAFAKVLCVKPDAQGSQTGHSWINAFQTLQDAFEAAESGDQVWVFAGEFEVSDSPLVWPRDVAVYGGFTGNEKSKGERSSEQFTKFIRQANSSSECFIKDSAEEGLLILDGFAFEDRGDRSLQTLIKLRTSGDVILQNLHCDGIAVDEALVSHVATRGDVKMQDCTWLNFSTNAVLFASQGHFLLERCVFDDSLYSNPLFDVKGKVLAKDLEIDGEMWTEASGQY